MTRRLSQTAALTMLVACVGMTAHAEGPESSAFEAGQQFDLTVQLDKTAPITGTSMDMLGSIKSDAGPKFNAASSSRAGVPNKEVPPPAGHNDNRGNPHDAGTVALLKVVAVGVSVAVLGGLGVAFAFGPAALKVVSGLVFFPALAIIAPVLADMGHWNDPGLGGVVPARGKGGRRK